MNVLPLAKQITVLTALAEGMSIRGIERLTHVHRDTVMRLGVRVGRGCRALQDQMLRNLPCRRLEVDELWAFVGKKQKRVVGDEPEHVGDIWTFVALDPDTKLVPAFRVGGRDAATATAFMKDVASRMLNRVQISSDGLAAYVEAVEAAFGSDVDYAQIVKTYVVEPVDHTKYSPPKVDSITKTPRVGAPEERFVSTSLVERNNLTIRMHVRRYARLTNAFSKRLEHHEAATAMHFAYYNFVKVHSAKRVTPAMEAGVTQSVWSMETLLGEAELAARRTEPLHQAPAVGTRSGRRPGTGKKFLERDASEARCPECETDADAAGDLPVHVVGDGAPR